MRGVLAADSVYVERFAQRLIDGEARMQRAIRVLKDHLHMAPATRRPIRAGDMRGPFGAASARRSSSAREG